MDGSERIDERITAMSENEAKRILLGLVLEIHASNADEQWRIIRDNGLDPDNEPD